MQQFAGFRLALDIPPSLVLFEMDAVVPLHHRLGERVFIGGLPNVRLWPPKVGRTAFVIAR